MISQTAQLLQRIIPPLPKGRARIISSDPDRQKPNSTAQAVDHNHNLDTRAANIESVFAAVSAGHNTTQSIGDYTGLSAGTVNKILHVLEDWPGGPRIVRTTGNVRQKHTFRPVAAEEHAA